tara:strand:- start:104 stop:316 length:213 start_codon:yes stop_codon:yes gene_type:complete
MSKSKQSRFEKNVIITLSVITNLFIIAGVSRHWNYHDNNTELAEALRQTAEVQEKASYGTGCQETYQNVN